MAKQLSIFDVCFPEPEGADSKQDGPDEGPGRGSGSGSGGGTGENGVPRVVWRFIRDAPQLAGGAALADVFCTVRPWPHQVEVAERVFREFPRRFLLCDEVGLGKTIEAGLALKKLVLTGAVRRALILVPRGLIRQWQEELYEKFNLHILHYTGHEFVDYFGRSQAATGRTNPWNVHPLVLSSSHLVKREERQGELLDADPWDLVILDEAHHARRTAPTAGVSRPNNLLRLLRGLDTRTAGLLLLTATPMQLDPAELWDLLVILGLGGLWGASADRFRDYFLHLNAFPEGGNRALLLSMLGDHLQNGGRIPAWLAEESRAALGDEGWEAMNEIVRGRRPADRLTAGEDAVLGRILTECTPLDLFSFHNTRGLLHVYRDEGLLPESLPVRRVDDVFVEFDSGDEAELYARIEEYARHYYQRALTERHPGLGLVTTVYRRRLTSSFYAVRRTLERRLAALGAGKVPVEFGDWLLFPQGSLTPCGTCDKREKVSVPLGACGSAAVSGPDPDPAGPGAHVPGRYPWFEDVMDDDDDDDAEQYRRFLASAQALHEDEISYLGEFVDRLGRVGTDTKCAHLIRHLPEWLEEYPTALVFTQYTDTMDYLRDRLYAACGGAVACYSGRGGEVCARAAADEAAHTGARGGAVRDTGEAAGTAEVAGPRTGAAWRPAPKELIKERLARGDIRILLCTDAAGEGLNLQTCGLLINYDMPWNPMRVEQRIGRIDRIGQVHDRVRVVNYFYRGTVEERVYARLVYRIGLFRTVVGQHQPILGRIENLVRRAGLAPPGEEEEAVRRVLRELDAEIDRAPVLPVWTRRSVPRPIPGKGWHSGRADGAADPDPDPGPGVPGVPARGTRVSGSGRPVWPAALEAVFTAPNALGRAGEVLPVPGDGVFALNLYHGFEQHVVTFRPDVFDRRPGSTQFFVYGHRAFARVIGRLAGDGPEPPGGVGRVAPSVLRVALPPLSPSPSPSASRRPESPSLPTLASVSAPGAVGYFHVHPDGRWDEIHTLAQLQHVLEIPDPELPDEVWDRLAGELTAHLENRRRTHLARRREAVRARVSGRLAALRAKAADILIELLCVDGARMDTISGEKILRGRLEKGVPPYTTLVALSGIGPEDVRFLPADRVRSLRATGTPRKAGRLESDLRRRAEQLEREYRVWEQALRNTAGEP
ncbi:MAG: helicase-related protein [Bacillota bacterium]